MAPISCAWCNRTIRRGNPVANSSYGICLTCLGDRCADPIGSVADLDATTADQLPFGYIRMDAEGSIVAYNTQAPALSGLSRTRVLGENFFRSVTPCTCVEEFEGTLWKMMAGGKPERKQLEFLFKFKDRATMVSMAVITDPDAGYATLLICKSGVSELAS